MILFLLGLVRFAVAGALNKRFGVIGRLDSFWLSNPISTVLGLLLARGLVVNVVPPEFTSPILLDLRWLGRVVASVTGRLRFGY
jgi:hypothetical protein